MPNTAQPITGVVFTGQFARVNTGLNLLAKGQLNRLFISGVNQSAGIRAETFASQFRLPNPLLIDLHSGRLVLGPQANNTLENAIETKNWLMNDGDMKEPVVLITSTLHMPRASLALEKTLGTRTVLRYCVSEEQLNYRTAIIEYFKYMITMIKMWVSVPN